MALWGRRWMGLTLNVLSRELWKEIKRSSMHWVMMIWDYGQSTTMENLGTEKLSIKFSTPIWAISSPSENILGSTTFAFLQFNHNTISNHNATSITLPIKIYDGLHGQLHIPFATMLQTNSWISTKHIPSPRASPCILCRRFTQKKSRIDSLPILIYRRTRSILWLFAGVLNCWRLSILCSPSVLIMWPIGRCWNVTDI